MYNVFILPTTFPMFGLSTKYAFKTSSLVFYQRQRYCANLHVQYYDV